VYVVAAAQPAPRYTGHSAIIDPRGEILAEAGDGAGEIVMADVSSGAVRSARSENPSLLNRRI
jgi:predicted amidohydrolase